MPAVPKSAISIRATPLQEASSRKKNKIGNTDTPLTRTNNINNRLMSGNEG